MSSDESEDVLQGPARSKRRRLNKQKPECFSASEDDGSPSSVSSDGSDSDGGSQIEERRRLGSPEDKPKSKYRIHVPKNGSLPQDTFYTQISRRSTSPYRIEAFRWQKPQLEAVLDPVAQSGPRTPSQPLRQLPAKETSLERNQRNDNHQSSLKSDIHTDPEEIDNVLADLPSDTFSSPEKSPNRGEPIEIPSSAIPSSQLYQVPQRLRAPQSNLRQTTLFGSQAPDVQRQTQSVRRHNWPMAEREEPPTHHKLDDDNLQTWIYPTNLGMTRDYQFSLVKTGLFHNLMIALPTGLGKTFIAATIMLNWFRWTKNAQIVFVAPTRPLVAQQIKACYEIAGIPASETTMLTGTIPPGIRAEEWNYKRVFFMTPQTIQNDLKTGICDPKRIVLLVVDEAHRATGGYAYVEVVNFLKRFNPSFRVLALTATPGSSIESVQEVIDGLSIARIEIRTEQSLDIRQYVHARNIETILFDNSEDMTMVLDLFSEALQPVLNKLVGMNAYWGKDPLMLTPYGCNQARQKWMVSDAGRNAGWGLKQMVMTIFSVLASLSHATELLKFHGIGPFFRKISGFRNDVFAGGKKGGKYEKQIIESESFRTMMTRVQSWINNADFIDHPKLEYLQDVVLNHFMDASEGKGPTGPHGTRIMIFAHYRDSAENVARILSRHTPMIRPRVFVGQANSKGSEGMDQKTQLDVVKKFQEGVFNTLVATSIGEEGLDIGEIDLIVCYDASASPIRMLQRMGRTGRKRAGNIIVTLMRGKEENNFIKAKDNYEKMQNEIVLGSKFAYHEESSRRIIPQKIKPIPDKRVIEIPLENTQADLPEPKKTGRKAPKRPPKKFHMPDNVRTNFVKASRMGEDESDHLPAHSKKRAKKENPVIISPLPSLEEALLTEQEERELERRFLHGETGAPEILDVPRNDAFPQLQRISRPTKLVCHSQLSKRTIDLLQTIHQSSKSDEGRYKRYLQKSDQASIEKQVEKRRAFFQKPTPGSSKIVSRPSPTAPDSTSSHTVRGFGAVENHHSDELDADPYSMTTDNDLDLAGPSSSTSTPPPPVAVDKPFYNSQLYADNTGDHEEAADELPELGMLIGNGQEQSTLDTDSLWNPMKAAGRRGGRRRIIEEEEDDEG